MNIRCMAIAQAILITLSFVTASPAATFDLVKQVLVSDDSDRDFFDNNFDPGIEPGPLTDDGDIVVRERSNLTQDNLQIRTFLEFDVSSLTAADVTAPGFSALFSIDFVTKLNTVNNMGVQIGRVLDDGFDGDSWDVEEGDLPLFEWARLGDEAGEDLAADTVVIIEKIRTDDLGIYTADVTPIVQDWVSGNFDNNGFVLYGTGDVFQGAGLDNAQLFTQVLGDFDENGAINVADFLILSGNLAAQLDGTVAAADGDMDLDGDIDLDDFGQFKDLFPGVVAAAQTVPEPSANVMASFGALLGLLVRRRRNAISVA